MLKIRLIIFMISIMSFLGCNNPFSDKLEKPYKVRIPVYKEDGKAYWEIKTLETLEDPVSVESSQIKVRVNTKFYSDHIEDQVPRAIYRVSADGILLPTDTSTILYYGLYYNMEQLVKFDQKIGVHGLMPYPRIASIQTDIVKSFSGPVKEWKNNLSYLPGYDRLVVYKFDESDLPAPLNLGLIAHEHFHAIFEHIVQPNKLVMFELQREVLEKMQASHNTKVEALGLSNEELSKMTYAEVFEKTRRTAEEEEAFKKEIESIHSGAKGYNFLMLNALTEGFADFWAWLVTGNEIPAKLTFSPEDYKNFNFESRKVHSSVMPVTDNFNMQRDFNYNRFLKEETTPRDPNSRVRSVRDQFYHHGAVYSVLLRSLSESLMKDSKSTESARVQTGAWVVQGLKNLNQQLVVFNETKDADEVLTQDLIVDAFIPDNMSQEIKTEVCGKIKTFLLFHNETYNNYKKCEGIP